MMKFRRLGRTGLKVAEVGFGAWAIGGSSYGPTTREESLKALETACARGVNFFDTADTYGHGESESLVAALLKGRPRAELIVASKAGWDFYQGGGSRKRFDPDYLTFACGESLKRLGTDYIDLYQLHNPSLEQIQQGEAVGALAALKQAGKIRFIGISVHREDEALAAVRDGRVDTLQLIFNLLDQRMAERVFDVNSPRTITGGAGPRKSSRRT
jgi:aryl-alcohol dehydrogenase-like predicted oxidoreductase